MSNPVDDKGNVRVDFAWGNMPLQPNDQRVAGSGGSYGAYGSTEGADPNFDAEYARAGVAIPSNILDVKLDDHVRATGDFELGLRPGWNGYPGWEPNTIGDGDYEVFIETGPTGPGPLYIFTPNPLRFGDDFTQTVLYGEGWPLSDQIGKIYIESASDEVIASLRSNVQWNIRALSDQFDVTYQVTSANLFNSGGLLDVVDESFALVSASVPGGAYRATELQVNTLAGTIFVTLIPAD